MSAKTFVLVHPTGFSGSELILPYLESQIKDEDKVIWLSSSEDQEWPFSFDYDEVILAPSGIVVGLDIEGEVFLCGGYYRACFRNAVNSLLDSDADFVIPTEGVYYYSSRTLEDQMIENNLSEEYVLELIDAEDNFRIERPKKGD